MFSIKCRITKGLQLDVIIGIRREYFVLEMIVRSIKVRDGFSVLIPKIIEMNLYELIRERLHTY